MSFFTTDTTGFQKKLNQQVQEYFILRNIQRTGNFVFWVKAFSIFFLWVLALLMLFKWVGNFSEAILAYLALGFFSLLMVFNIGHDAAHQAVSKKRWINDLLAYSFNLLGGNRFSWILKHNIGHHFYTNIHDKDVDIETVPLFRVSPHTPLKWYYRFQHLYIIPLYCLLSLVLVFFMDFKVMFTGLSKKLRATYVKEWMILIFTKCMYLTYIIIVPSIILPLSLGEVVICFLLMHCLLGLVISLVLLPSHFVGHARFYRQSDLYEIDKNSWSIHQLLTTIDIAPDSKFVHFVLGGLNVNVLHHIYPKICHVHFVPLVNILKKTALSYNMPYQYYSLWQAMIEHFRFLKKMGRTTES